jgi:hypothetical protein
MPLCNNYPIHAPVIQILYGIKYNYIFHANIYASVKLHITQAMTMALGWDSSVGRAIRSGDQILVGARFSTPVQSGSGAHPASYTMGTRSFPGVKRPGSGGDHPPPSSIAVKERVGLYLYCPFGLPWPVLGWTSWLWHYSCMKDTRHAMLKQKLLYFRTKIFNSMMQFWFWAQMICNILSFNAYTEWPQKMYTLFTHQYLWNKFKWNFYFRARV